MKYKKGILITLCLLIVLTLGVVSASDNITSDALDAADESPLEIDEISDNSSELSLSDGEILTTAGSFSDVQTMINNAKEGDTILLSADCTGSGTQINVNKRITIDGNNFKLDAKHQSGILNITASNVIIKNLILTNGNSTGAGGAVCWNAKSGTIENCQFIDNYGNDGGALYYKGSNALIKNSVFTNNAAYYNGAIYMNSLNGKIIGCNFTNNIATDSAGAIGWVKRSNGLISNSRFTGNSAPYGGAVYINNATNMRIENSDFDGNTVTKNGGAIYWDNANKATITGSTFKNNIANQYGGAVYYDEGDNIAVVNCDFDSCAAKSNHGGGVYCYSPNATNVSVTGCSFVNCSSQDCGGAIRLCVKTGSISDCSFVKCNTKYDGGAIYLSAENNCAITDCSFVNCKSDSYGGAIRFEGNDGKLLRCGFENCTANSCGGAVYWNYESENGYVYASSFVNCHSQDYGGAIYWCYSAKNGYVMGCSFVNCSSCVDEDMNNLLGDPYDNSTDYTDDPSSDEPGTYTDEPDIMIDPDSPSSDDDYDPMDDEYPDESDAQGKGGAIYWDDDSGKIENSTFIKNYAPEGKAIYVTDEAVNINNCKFNGNLSAVNDAVTGGTTNNCVVNVNISTTTTLTVNPDNAYVGQNVSIIPTVLDEYVTIKGTVTLYINDVEIGTVESGEEYNYIPTEEGTFNILAIFDGNEYYTESQSATQQLTAEDKKDSQMNIHLNDIELGQKEIVNVTLASDATGNVAIYVNDNLFSNVPVENGAAVYELEGLDLGTYNVTVNYSGDVKYLNGSASDSFTVSPATKSESRTMVLINVANAYLGDNITVTSIVYNNKNEIISGTVDLYVNSIKIGTANINEAFTYTPKAVGSYLIEAKFNQTLEYYASSGNATVNVIPAVVPENITSDDDGIIILQFPDDAEGTVEVFINGLRVDVVNVVNGIAKIDLSKYKGNYTFLFVYSGDEKYASFTKESNVTVYVNPAIIKASDSTVLYTAGTKYKATVYESEGVFAKSTPVTFIVNGKTVKNTKTNSKGVASFKVTQAPGTYTVSISSLGRMVQKTLKVKHVVTLKSATVKKSAKKLVLTATLSKVNKKVLKNKKVTFKFSGKKYTAKTNKKGVAKVTIKSDVLKKLKVGKKVTYQATYLKDTVKKTAKVKK